MRISSKKPRVFIRMPRWAMLDTLGTAGALFGGIFSIDIIRRHFADSRLASDLHTQPALLLIMYCAMVGINACGLWMISHLHPITRRFYLWTIPLKAVVVIAYFMIYRGIVSPPSAHPFVSLIGWSATDISLLFSLWSQIPRWFLWWRSQRVKQLFEMRETLRNPIPVVSRQNRRVSWLRFIFLINASLAVNVFLLVLITAVPLQWEGVPAGWPSTLSHWLLFNLSLLLTSYVVTSASWTSNEQYLITLHAFLRRPRLMVLLAASIAVVIHLMYRGPITASWIFF